jgi:hypothetical protein
VSKISNDEMTDLLQRGLRGIPELQVSSDFDSRVRAGLRRPEPWWQIVRQAAFPLLAPAACSLAVTLALLIGMSGASTGGARMGSAQPSRAVALQPRADRIRSVEQDLDRIDSDTPSLCGFLNSRRAVEANRAAEPRAEDKHGTSGRRATRHERGQA